MVELAGRLLRRAGRAAVGRAVLRREPSHRARRDRAVWRRKQRTLLLLRRVVVRARTGRQGARGGVVNGYVAGRYEVRGVVLVRPGVPRPPIVNHLQPATAR